MEVGLCARRGFGFWRKHLATVIAAIASHFWKDMTLAWIVIALSEMLRKARGFIIICSIAAHAGPRGSVQPVPEHHPSTSTTEYGYRADRPHDRVR